MNECKPLGAGQRGLYLLRRHPLRADHRRHQGRAVQLDLIKPKLKVPGTNHLKLKCDGLLSTVAFKFKLRRYMKEMVNTQFGLPTTRVMARIDNLDALHDLPGILAETDVILLARGELGAVVASEKMFAVQKHVLRMCEKLGKTCIVTRLVDSMISAPRPTRAEVGRCRLNR